MLLAPHGTRGDVQPMVALAVALRDRGHAVSFVAPSNFIGWIRARGFDAESNGVDAEEMLRAAGPNLQSIRWQWRHLAGLTATLFASVARASAGTNLIVGAGPQLAAASVAEWRDVPYASRVLPVRHSERRRASPGRCTQTLPPGSTACSGSSAALWPTSVGHSQPRPRHDRPRSDRGPLQHLSAAA